MPRRGRDLEKLVALIEYQLGNADAISVKSPMFLPDSDSGEMREHDVVLQIRQGHHELTIAIECRDRKAKVDSSAIDCFSEKCRVTGVSSGIVVSSSGFTKPAIAKAAKRNIRCLMLSQAAQFDWCHCAGFWFYQPKVLDGLLDCVAAEPIAYPYKAYRNDGTEVTNRDAGLMASIELQKITPFGLSGGPYTHLFTYGPQDAYVIGADGRRQEILGMNLWVTYEVTQKLLPLDFLQYSDDQSGDVITSAARAKFNVGDTAAQLTMIKNSDGEIQVSITHEPLVAD